LTDDKQEEVTSSHYFQALDRAHVASLYLQTVFKDDAVLARHPKLAALFDRAVDSLEQLYQDIGQLEKTWEQ
jgi:hypothetical protein